MTKHSKSKRPTYSVPLLQTYITAAVLSLSTYYYCINYTQLNRLYVLLYTLITAYLPSYFDRSEHNCKNQRYWPGLVHWSGWRLIFKYFRPQLIIDDETKQLLESGKQHIIVSHPHGVASYNHFILMTDMCQFQSQYTVKPRRELVANILFRLPYIRELVLWLGCIDAGKSVAEATLNSGYSIQAYVGGEHEQLLSNPKQPTLVISKRKGIARLALKHNIPLIPTFCFGEDQCYNTYSALLPFQLWLSKNFKIALTAATGRFYLPFVPYRQQLTVVVGKPVQLESRQHIENGTLGEYTDTEVRELLDLYIKGITDLYNQHKDKYSKYQINELKIV